MYQGYEHIVVEQEGKLLIIKFNNPRKKNCVNRPTYVELGRVLRAVAKDALVTVVAFTGVGEYFSAGNDLSQSSNVTDMDAYIQENSFIFRELVSATMDCPKVLVAVVNGPAIGIGATLAGLCDLVWCSDTAYFSTPFVKLGIVPEACSSYLFPLAVGRSKATEMLLFSENLSAQEAYHYHFVSRIFNNADLDTVIWPKIREYSNLPPESMMESRRLLRKHEKGALLEALNAECEALNKRFYSEEFFNALIEFSTRKNKSKL